jgi:ribosomal-protein-serine acetyltransferase
MRDYDNAAAACRGFVTSRTLVQRSLESTPGISLIPVSVEHASLLASFVQQNLEHLIAFLPALGALSSVEVAKVHLLAAAENAANEDVFEWHLFDGETLCGAIRLKDIDKEGRSAKIAYFVGSGFAGRGIATSAVRAVLSFSFGNLNLNRIELRCASENKRSMGVAARLGFVREGILRQDECLHGKFVDHHVFGLLAGEFNPGASPPPPGTQYF